MVTVFLLAVALICVVLVLGWVVAAWETYEHRDARRRNGR